MRFVETHCKYTKKVSVLCSVEGRGFLASYCASQQDLLPFYPIHRHEELELVFVQDGSVCVWCNGKQYVANKGDVCIFAPFGMHSFTCSSRQSVTLRGVVFNFRQAAKHNAFDASKRFASFFNGAEICPVVKGDENGADVVRDCVEQVFASSFDVDCVADCLEKVFVTLSAKPSSDGSSVADQKRFHAARQAIDYIGVHYAEKFSIAQLAQACGYSEFYLMKLFKQLVGVTVVDYVNCVRLFHAEELLSTNGFAEVAKRVGYDNVSYFNRQFKRLYGCTPTQFCCKK